MPRLKREGVVRAGLQPEMYYYLGVADEIFQQELGHEFVVSNAVAARPYPTFHGSGFGLDGRTQEHFDWMRWRHRPEMYRVVHRLRARLHGRGFDIVLEPDELTETNLVVRFRGELDRLIGHHDLGAITPEQYEALRRQVIPHLHGEFDPKPGEVLWVVVA